MFVECHSTGSLQALLMAGFIAEVKRDCGNLAPHPLAEAARLFSRILNGTTPHILDAFFSADRFQVAALKRSRATVSVSAMGRFHQLWAEKISTSTKPV